MNEVGRFSRKPSDVINTVTDMVVHDMRAMQDNIGALDGMKLGDGNAIVIGKVPEMRQGPLCDEKPVPARRSAFQENR